MKADDQQHGDSTGKVKGNDQVEVKGGVPDGQERKQKKKKKKKKSKGKRRNTQSTKAWADYARRPSVGVLLQVLTGRYMKILIRYLFCIEVFALCPQVLGLFFQVLYRILFNSSVFNTAFLYGIVPKRGAWRWFSKFFCKQCLFHC